jgi:hypothetical protein
MENKKINIRGSFEALDPNKPIFEKIKEQKWWNLFSEDKELYIEIRKDNYINVYYYGNSLAEIEYPKNENEFVAKIHKKFIGINVGTNEQEYTELDLKGLNTEVIKEIKKRILKESKIEKKIQGEMILKNSKYIDSEFQYNKDEPSRIDLIELSDDGILSFVELKQIEDSRLRNDEKRNPELPEIIDQMDKYKKFINKYENEIIDYYKKIIQLKNDLEIFKQKRSTNFKLNKTPKLIIANTYKELSKGKIERIRAIEDLLKKQNIDYEIIPWHPVE